MPQSEVNKKKSMHRCYESNKDAWMCKKKSEEWVVRIVWTCIGHYIVRWGSLC